MWKEENLSIRKTSLCEVEGRLCSGVLYGGYACDVFAFIDHRYIISILFYFHYEIDSNRDPERCWHGSKGM